MAVSSLISDIALTCLVVQVQRMFSELLVGMLSTVEGLSVVATASTAAEGIDACHRHRPGLLILDHSLPDQGGEVVAEALATIQPQAHLIILSAQANCFVCPASVRPQLHAVIDKIDAYETLGNEIAKLLNRHPASRIQPTAREKELVLLIGSGLSNLQIAKLMEVSVHTVETHRRNVSQKLGMKGAELIRYATLKKLQAGGLWASS